MLARYFKVIISAGYCRHGRDELYVPNFGRRT